MTNKLQIIEAIHSNSLDQYDTQELISILKDADDLYYNDEESFLTDFEYDTLYRYTKNLAPNDIYFLNVGSDVRGGKVKLPFPLGSLDQIYEGEIEQWVRNNNLLHEEFVITDKLDGASNLSVYAKNSLHITFSRGNGFEGADTTRHSRQIKAIPDLIPVSSIAVRGEVIMKKDNFPLLHNVVQSRSGRPYKNPRNAVSGMMNAKTNPTLAYQYLDFLAYEILGDTRSKSEQLQALESLGFKVPVWKIVKGYELTDATLTAYLNTRRANCEYEIDGVVIDVNSASTRSRLNPTKSTLNPAYAIKYKVADADNQAIVEVIDVEWNPSKDNYLKPRVQIKPINLRGVTITFATGFNARFIVDNGIGPKAKIRIVRSGDVIPFITNVVERVIPQMPNVAYHWNDTMVDIIGDEVSDEVHIKRLIDFFASIDAPMLREGNIRILYNAGYKTTESIIKMSEVELLNLIGSNGEKIYNGLQEKLSSIPLFVLMGSSHFFGRGVGKRKFKKLIQVLGDDTVFNLNNRDKDIDIVANVCEFDFITAEKITNGMSEFRDWYEELKDYISIGTPEVSGTTLQNEKVVFTGFRDKELEAKVESLGGTMQSSVSSKTTIVVTTDPNSNTGKIKKARELGIKVVGVDDFNKMLEE